MLCVLYYSNGNHYGVSYVITYFYNYFWFRNVTLMDADMLLSTIVFEVCVLYLTDPHNFVHIQDLC